MPSGQEMKRISTSNIKPGSLLQRRRRQPVNSRAGVEVLRLRGFEQRPLGYRGVPTPTVIPWPTSTSIVLMKSGAINRAHA